jgi:hypothetical protein
MHGSYKNNYSIYHKKLLSNYEMNIPNKDIRSNNREQNNCFLIRAVQNVGKIVRKYKFRNNKRRLIF